MYWVNMPGMDGGNSPVPGFNLLYDKSGFKYKQPVPGFNLLYDKSGFIQI